MSRRLTLSLSNLYLDLQNPRYEEQQSQNEALNTIAGEQKGKLIVLLEVVNGVGFTSVASAGSGYVLGMDRAIEDGAAVWIHSREDGTGGLKVSTQFM